MFKFVFSAANGYQKNLTSHFSPTIALLCGSKNASSEPLAPNFRSQNQNLNKLLKESFIQRCGLEFSFNLLAQAFANGLSTSKFLFLGCFCENRTKTRAQAGAFTGTFICS
ncbi:hypothetical protein [Rufibacter quisquiliarum]|uniref:hypothetical protein n=1 Tax=Rufibacter quisquiliarum TaxID=1549639 RepID=UPI0015FD05E8|nr:hypothetical protein [Rufibacter quisquiliarum]